MSLILPNPHDEGAPGIPYVGRQVEGTEISYNIKPDKYYYQKLKVFKRTGITFDKMADEPDYINSDMEWDKDK